MPQLSEGQRKTLSWAIPLALLFALVRIGNAPPVDETTPVSDVPSASSVLIQNGSMETPTQTFVSTWKDASGTTHTVTTPPNDGEEIADHAARHAAAVTALQKLFPPAK